MTTPFVTSPATQADYPGFARLFPELGTPEGTPSAERFVDAIAPDTIVVREGDAVIGYAWGRRRGEWFHVVHVVVASTHRARGVGRALMNAMRERARAAGLERWMLNVKPDNVAAHALYERCGMRAAHESTSLRFSWADTDRLAPSPHVTTRVLESADDAAFESALSLSRGELEGFRTVLARTVIGAELEGRAVGVLAFDPSMPGAAPFRVRAPEYARALLEALRPIARARAEHDHVFTFIEGDPVLQAALEAAGARPVLRVLRMAGQISG